MKNGLPTYFRVISILLIVFSISMFAQNDSWRSSTDGGYGYFMVSGNMADIDDLNANLLSAGGFEDFSEALFSMGGGGHVVFNRLILGGEGHGFIEQTGTDANNQYKSTLTGGMGAFNIGFTLFTNRTWNIYPVLGIGGISMELRIEELGTASFDDILAEPGRAVSLKQESLLLNAALGIDYVFNFGKNLTSRKGGFILGLRAGYNFVPAPGDWGTEELTVSGGPDFPLTGPFLRLVIGAGG